MKHAKVISVIETTLTLKGDGAYDPIRIITEYWSVDGILLAKVDPCPPESFDAEKLSTLRDIILRHPCAETEKAMDIIREMMLATMKGGK